MKLYYLPGTCSTASTIACFEAGIKIELVKVDRRTKKADGVDFITINPKGYVPALRTDDGDVLTESVTVLQYLADRKPESKLAPALGTMERYHLMEWLSFVNSEVHKQFTPLYSQEASDDTKQFARNGLAKRLTYLQQALANKTYLMGEQFTVADAYLFVVLGWGAPVGVDLAQYPALKTFHERIGARPHVIEAMTAEGLIKK